MLQSMLRVFLLLNLVVFALAIVLGFSGQSTFAGRVDAQLWGVGFMVLLGAGAIVEAIGDARKQLLAKLDGAVDAAVDVATTKLAEHGDKLVDTAMKATRALAKRMGKHETKRDDQ